MSIAIYPKAARELMRGNIDFDAHDFRILYLKSTAVYDPDDEFVTDVISGGQEISVAGYARITLTGEVVNFSTPASYFDAADTTSAVMAAGQTIGSVVLFRQVTNDTDSKAVAWYDGGILPVATGGIFTIGWNALGLIGIS